MEIKITEFSEELPQTDDFRSIVLNQTPLIDVRAPVEFSQGAFTSACNLPLMSDDERHRVGICYKEHGNEVATRLGHQLVSESVRAPRVESWIDFIEQNPDALLYCFRGGQRSKISQQWLSEQGRSIVRLKGGYKAFRRYLIDFMDEVPNSFSEKRIKPLVLAGRTGSGKTLVIHRLKHALDLEGLAHHRGSAFGRHATPQPSQIDFENQLAMALIRFEEQSIGHLVLEDEGRNIGSVSMSKSIFDYFKSGPRVVVDTPLEERVAITLDEYVVQAQQEYPTVEAWIAFMDAALSRIQKRLGGERYKRVLQQFYFANQQQSQTGDCSAHQVWIETLLVEYYDPMYDYQMGKNQQPICFKGSMDETVEFLQSY